MNNLCTIHWSVLLKLIYLITENLLFVVFYIELNFINKTQPL